ncbi:MAG: hypothetical protein JW942_08900 [Opitutales bacterium]|nr:hypothetical protein [Opitutales bacterium]
MTIIFHPFDQGKTSLKEPSGSLANLRAVKDKMATFNDIRTRRAAVGDGRQNVKRSPRSVLELRFRRNTGTFSAQTHPYRLGESRFTSPLVAVFRSKTHPVSSVRQFQKAP